MKRRLRTRRSGVTLLELLVVATVMLTLTAVSVPAIKPMMEARLTTSAAASVSTYLNRARARAMATGRPCGVAFEFFEGTYNDSDDSGLNSDAVSPGSASLILRQVEAPPCYSGLETTATVDVFGGNDRFIVGNGDELSVSVSGDVLSNGDQSWVGRKIRPLSSLNVSAGEWAKYVAGESAPRIQFNSIGPYFPIVRDENGGVYIVQLPGIDLPQRVAAPFKVLRDPRATMTAPIGLAQGAVVDLAYSGTDGRDFALGSGVTVLFAPNGEVDSIVDGSGKWTPTDTIYLMIGRWDRIAALSTGATVEEGGNVYYLSGAEDGLWNYEDASNRWVTINPRSGIVSTVEVSPPSIYKEGNERVSVLDSREFARNSKRNIGAR